MQLAALRGQGAGFGMSADFIPMRRCTFMFCSLGRRNGGSREGENIVLVECVTGECRELCPRH